jgi:hypothetical protein
MSNNPNPIAQAAAATGGSSSANNTLTQGSTGQNNSLTGNIGDLLTSIGGSVLDLGDGILERMGDPNDPVGQLLNIGAASMISKYTQPNRPEVGYQGGIDRLTKVRKRVEQPQSATEGSRSGILTTQDIGRQGTMMKTVDDPENPGQTKRVPMSDEEINSQRFAGDRYKRGYERRPGGRGRRYFTDTQYAKTPEEDLEPPTLEEAEAKAAAQAEDLKTRNANVGTKNFAAGGIASTHNGYYLGGKTDGMADKVPARIDNNQEARLSDGEFVIPADVVSHLGNGNSDAGAQQLHGMMDNVRQARTGTTEQGTQINPQNFMPKMAQGGIAKFSEGSTVTGTFDAQEETPVGQEVGQSGAIANWAGDYVTDMLAYGRAEAESPYEAYEGPLTAGTSTLQDQAMTGVMALNNPLSSSSVVNQMGAFDPNDATKFMNPYEQNVIDRSAADMRRQDQITQLQNRQALTNAGAFGGSRDALMRAEAAGNLTRNIGDMAAAQRAQGFTQAMDRAQQNQQNINQYGFDTLAAQMNAGQTQRDIASEGIAADYAQFREERDYNPKMVQYMQSLLQGLPVAARTTSYTEPSALGEIMQGQSGLEYLLQLFGYQQDPTNINTETT